MTAPIKTCDYCGATGEMPTFMNGETICYTCLHVLPKTLPEARQELMRLRAVLAVVAQPKKVHAVVCFYGLHYYVSALFFDPTSAIARCRKEINNSAYPDSWKVVEFEIEDTLDSVQPAPSIPEGWKLVPIEPTEEMLHALIDGANQYDAWKEGYRDMLAAAPEAHNE